MLALITYCAVKSFDVWLHWEIIPYNMYTYIVWPFMYVCTVFMYSYIRDSHKDKGNYKGSVEYDTIAGEAASIQDSPMQYDYARTGPMKVKILHYSLPI